MRRAVEERIKNKDVSTHVTTRAAASSLKEKTCCLRGISVGRRLTKNKVMKQKRILANINVKSFRGPSTRGLNDMRADTKVS